MGITALLIAMAKNIAIQNGSPLAIYNLRVQNKQLITKMISSESGISYAKLKKGKLEPHEWQMLNLKAAKILKAPIFIDDTTYNSIFNLAVNIMKQVLKKNLNIIFIDSLQILATKKLFKEEKTTEEKLAIILKLLKSLAKELEIPIILISELLPEVEFRGGYKRPFLLDLPMYETIEKQVDIISFLYRPEYYGFTIWDNYKSQSCIGEAELFVSKKNKELGTMRLKFNGELMSFSDIN